MRAAAAFAMARFCSAGDAAIHHERYPCQMGLVARLQRFGAPVDPAEPPRIGERIHVPANGRLGGS